MSRFTPAKGLNQTIAARIGVPAATHIARDLAAAAAAAAPPTKMWVTMGDALVRRWHRQAQGQTVPDNLRFTLNTPEWEQQHQGYGPREMARGPRDPDLSYVNRVHCRCVLSLDADGVSATIHADPARLSRARATATVYCDHPLASASEFGTDGDIPARFMAIGVRTVAAKLR